MLALPFDRRERGVAGRLGFGDAGEQLVVARRRGACRRLELLDAFHDGELDVLEIGLPFAQGGQFGLEPRDVLHAGGGLETLHVARDAGLDDLDVRLDALELETGVLERPVVGDAGEPRLLRLDPERGDRRELREGVRPVRELLQLRIDRLELEEDRLILRACLQRHRGGTNSLQSLCCSTGRSRNPTGRCGVR